MAIPSRFRNPIDDPDPALVAQYRRLFTRGVGSPSPAQVELLARALERGDPLADACVSAPSDAATRALLDQCREVPLWVDVEALSLGARTARRAGVIGNFVLADFALMGGYRSAAIAKALVSTGELTTATARRLIHTGAYVGLVQRAGAILPGGEAWDATLRVRMVHARVRASLSRDWDHARWGVPLNQADTLGTNLLFSTGFLEGCKQWGLRFSRDEEEALVHLWRYVGYLMGIDEALLPVDAAGGRRALYLVGLSQPAPSEDSRRLARSLYELPITFARKGWRRRIARAEMAVRLGMTRRLLGDESVDQLGLPASAARAALTPIIGVIRAVEGVRMRVPGGTRAAYRIGDLVLSAGERLAQQLIESAALKANVG
ncbi:MAG TPA: oxygenase MpaB family protein [Polyangiales bacterium]|nr:oxygenase MpaB family protein [Polyangiales bacterium]